MQKLNQLATVLALPDKHNDHSGACRHHQDQSSLKRLETAGKAGQGKNRRLKHSSAIRDRRCQPPERQGREGTTFAGRCSMTTVDEALPEVDSFIDRAITNGQTVVA